MTIGVIEKGREGERYSTFKDNKGESNSMGEGGKRKGRGRECR